MYWNLSLGPNYDHLVKENECELEKMTVEGDRKFDQEAINV